MPQTTEVLKLPPPDRNTIERLKQYMIRSGYLLREVQAGLLSASRPGAVVTLYSTGRLVVQGEGASGILAAIQQALSVTQSSAPALMLKPTPTLPGRPASPSASHENAWDAEEGEDTGQGPLPTVTIYTDGACVGNPGPGGYGAVLLRGDKRRELSGGYQLTTNNRMEIMGCIAALEALKKPCRVTLYSDSQYVVNTISKGWAKSWKAKGWRRGTGEAAINPDLWRRLLDLCGEHQVEFRWVRGHNGDPENEACDRLAVGASHAPGLPRDPGYKPAR